MPVGACSRCSDVTRLSLQASRDLFTWFCVLIPAGDLPGRPSKCSLAWQRGAKLQYTAAAFVDGQEHVVYWDETLKQVRGKSLRERPLMGLMDMIC